MLLLMSMEINNPPGTNLDRHARKLTHRDRQMGCAKLQFEANDLVNGTMTVTPTRLLLKPKYGPFRRKVCRAKWR